MDISKTLQALEVGFQNPATALYRTVIEDKYMENVGVRRKTKQPQHSLWALSLGEVGQQPAAIFYGYKPSDAIKKAMAWRGIPKVTRGPRKQTAAPQGG
jgi:hypothetical protein